MGEILRRGLFRLVGGEGIDEIGPCAAENGLEIRRNSDLGEAVKLVIGDEGRFSLLELGLAVAGDIVSCYGVSFLERTALIAEVGHGFLELEFGLMSHCTYISCFLKLLLLFGS